MTTEAIKWALSTAQLAVGAAQRLAERDARAVLELAHEPLGRPRAPLHAPLELARVRRVLAARVDEHDRVRDFDEHLVRGRAIELRAHVELHLRIVALGHVELRAGRRQLAHREARQRLVGVEREPSWGRLAAYPAGERDPVDPQEALSADGVDPDRPHLFPAQRRARVGEAEAVA